VLQVQQIVENVCEHLCMRCCNPSIPVCNAQRAACLPACHVQRRSCARVLCNCTAYIIVQKSRQASSTTRQLSQSTSTSSIVMSMLNRLQAHIHSNSSCDMPAEKPYLLHDAASR
jgi:hypothetical protein